MWPWKKQPQFPAGSFTGFPFAGPTRNVGGEVIPDRMTTEPVRGYRYWRIITSGESLALLSLHADYVWDTQNTAQCLPLVNSTQHDDKAPHPECSCGFYSEHPEHQLQGWQAQTAGVASASGSILMSGRIIVCEMGYKAEHVEIESPVSVDVKCQFDCDTRPAFVELPGVGRSFASYCNEHRPTYHDAYQVVTVDADIWLRHAVTDLASRYEGVEFITSAQLGD